MNIRVFKTIPEHYLPSFARVHQADPPVCPVRCAEDFWAYIVGINDADDIVSMACVYQHAFEWQGVLLQMGYLGLVMTEASWRRQGYATALARTSTQEMFDLGCDVAFLEADLTDPSIVRLYRRAGFTPLGHAYTFTGRSGRVYERTNAMIASLGRAVITPNGSGDVFDLMLHTSDVLDVGTGDG